MIIRKPHRLNIAPSPKQQRFNNRQGLFGYPFFFAATPCF